MFKNLKNYFEENMENFAAGMAALNGNDIYTYIAE